MGEKNTAAEVASVSMGGVNRAFTRDYTAGSSTESVKYGQGGGPEYDHDYKNMESSVGGKSVMPHTLKEDWNANGSRTVTLTLHDGAVTTWNLNPAGYVTQKTHADGSQLGYVWDVAGRLIQHTTPAGNQSWDHDPVRGHLTEWKIDGQTAHKIESVDLFGRPDQVEDDSGVRSLTYNNGRWFLETETWTSGLLNDFQLVRDVDSRGRASLLEVKQEGTTRYNAVPAYRHDSESLEKLTVTGPGFPSVEIHYSGNGGVADGIEYRVGGQPTFTWSRERAAGGLVDAISTGFPEFNQDWDRDAMGRMSVLTRYGVDTTYTYADNGSLARAQRSGEDREYTFTDRGELAQEKLNGLVLDAHFDDQKSGIATFRENLRQFTLHGTAHAEATVHVFANTNLVTTTTSPFAVTLDENHYPGMALSNGPFPWKVTGKRPGQDYIGEMAIADLEGEAWLPDAEETFVIHFGRRTQDSLHNFEWNAADQLLKVEQRHGPMRVENVYDGQQRRVEKRVYRYGNLQRTHHFVYDGWLPVVEEVRRGNGALETRNLYVYGAGPNGQRLPGLGATGQLALIIHQTGGGLIQISAPVYNHRLDIIGLVCVESGNVVAQYDYEPFGRQTAASGPRAHQNPFRFATAYFDGEVGLNYFGYRHYDPRTKQWLSRDPIGEAGGLNLYGYANNDPVNNIDFLGLTTVKEYQDIIARLEQSEREAIEFTNNSLSGWRNWRVRSQLNRETKNAYSAEIRENRRRMFQLEEELKQFAYRRSLRRMSNRNISSEFSKEQLNEMLDDELKYLLENISDRDEAALGWIRGEASIYRAAEISANEIRNSLFQLSASRALYTNQFKPTVPEVYGQSFNFSSVRTTVYRVEGMPNTRITIGEGGQVTVQGDQMLFLNFGDKQRAQAFLNQRLGQGMPGAQMKSFEVPASFLDDLRAAAVPESMAKQFPGRPILVDPTKAADQFGLRPDQIKALQEAIIQGSGSAHGK
ncbi:MAG: RHS repeat-associated core domain-containing protein [Kiritimatiellae bacterium]|nr:RHS repeat-associated core domain-containing protein [Kiritimatiellia bacterium]